MQLSGRPNTAFLTLSGTKKNNLGCRSGSAGVFFSQVVGFWWVYPVTSN